MSAIVNAVWGRIRTAHSGWRHGRIPEETIFLSRVVERLEHEWNCDYAQSSNRRRLNVRAAVLHRANQNSDAFGSDIAITIEDSDSGYLKTALLQLKVIRKDGTVLIEATQLREMRNDADVSGRGFVVAIDRQTCALYVKAASEIEPRRGETMTEDPSDWLTLRQWMRLWLICEEGDLSDSGTRAIEERLEALIDGNGGQIPGFDIGAWVQFGL